MSDVVEKPRVTFALLSYNQEQYIREAVGAALGQDYPNLEVVISDDCSSDGTFGIINEIVSSYSGPHKIISWRNSENLGIVGNVNRVFSDSTGDLVVMAAGDDVSSPGRVSALVDAWLSDGCRADCVYSNCLVINSHGDLVGRRDMAFEAEKSLADAAKEGVIVLGAVAAWSRRLWLSWGGVGESELAEDSFLTVRAKLGGGLLFVPQDLVSYRSGVSSWVVGMRSPEDVRAKGLVLSGLIWRNAVSSHIAFLRHGDPELVRLAGIRLARADFYQEIHRGSCSVFFALWRSLVLPDIRFNLAIRHIAYRFFPSFVLLWVRLSRVGSSIYK